MELCEQEGISDAGRKCVCALCGGAGGACGAGKEGLWCVLVGIHSTHISGTTF